MHIQYIIILLQILFILRFHLEMSKLSAFMEPVNTIRRITNPLVMPVKKIIPVPRAKKVAALIVAFFVPVIILFIMFPVASVVDVLKKALYFTISSWIEFLLYGMFIYVIGSWIQVDAMAKMNYILHYIFKPLLTPIRRIIPSVAGLDFSPMIFLFGLSMLSNWIMRLF